MIHNLPFEVLQQVISHLPTASSIINLAATNRKLYHDISADDYAVFRSFVQRAFPSIKTPPVWRDVACALTSRSRAWDRRALVARECCPPPDDDTVNHRAGSGQKFGYVPVIDSYEESLGGHLSNRKEVLAWGAAGRLRVRTTDKGSARWSSLRSPDDHLPENDILDVRLLRPHQRSSADSEVVIMRKANKEIVKVETGAKHDEFVQTGKFAVKSHHVDCMDVSRAVDPIIALCNTKSLTIYPVHADAMEIAPAETLILEQTFSVRHRKRCVRFLSDNRVAVGVQFVEGRDRAPIQIYDINSRASPNTALSSRLGYTPHKSFSPGRHGPTTLAVLDEAGENNGQLFLSGWTDGVVRLHDTRVPRPSVAEYTDFVDDGQILALLPIGYEKFFAGSHQNACLKTFDMRMPGARAYSYIDARLAHDRDISLPRKSPQTKRQILHPRWPQRDINIFLALSVNYAARPWQPLPSQNDNRLPRYRGSIYSLSAPSPMSSTVYAGIENHVIQLDFIGTDDLRRGILSPLDMSSGETKTKHRRVLNLSCYERPRAGHESTDAVLLRKQIDPSSTVSEVSNDGKFGECEEGWDERWRLTTYDRGGDKGANWRRRRGR